MNFLVKTIFANSLHLIVTLLLSLFLIAGCQDNPAQQYGDTLVKAKKSSQDAAYTADLDTYKKSIEMYRSEKGKAPESIEELETVTGRKIDRDKYNYNPADGTITLK